MQAKMSATMNLFEESINQLIVNLKDEIRKKGDFSLICSTQFDSDSERHLLVKLRSSTCVNVPVYPVFGLMVFFLQCL